MNIGLENSNLWERAIKLLHSSHPNSAAELRMIVDEVMAARLGPDKTLTKMLSKKQLENESNFPGRASTPEPTPLQMEVDEVINLTHSPPKTISDSPDTIIDSDDAISNIGTASGSLTMMAGGDEDTNLKEFGDLNCCVCKDMMFTATNRLVECSKCGSLYHQECHKPAITNEEASDDQQHNWQCDVCCNKPSTSKVSVAAAAAAPPHLSRGSTASVIVSPAEEPISLVSKSKSSHSSSSSNSSSPFYKQEASTSSSSRSHHKSSSSSKSSSKEDRSSKTISAPTINIISADKSSSKKSHSSSKSSKSSKHHESSSSKRKSK